MDLNRYEISENAIKDIDDIVNYISIDLSNKLAAENLFKKIFETIDHIVDYPYLGVQLNNYFIENSKIRKLLIDNYIMYYKYNEEKRLIIVLRIVSSKKNINTFNIRWLLWI